VSARKEVAGLRARTETADATYPSRDRHAADVLGDVAALKE
jgi:hypothetical protein